jgi:molybdopterin/thiamine biosynthesis adenylyltransferase
MLTDKELQKYDRQIMIEGFGGEGQERLKRAKAFMAGAGGLCSSAAVYLAAAGVGTIRIVDHDKVEPSNLNRQILHWEEDIGRRKIESAAMKLKRVNSNLKIEAIEERLDETNIDNLVAGSDLIIDAMDNLHVRLLLNRVALKRNIPLLHGAVRGFEGRATTVIPGKTDFLKCIYRGVLQEEKFPVVGVAPGIIGCIQAMEAIKLIVGIGELLTGRLIIFDGLSMKFNEYKTKKDPNCEHCGDKGKFG